MQGVVAWPHQVSDRCETVGGEPAPCLRQGEVAGVVGQARLSPGRFRGSVSRANAAPVLPASVRARGAATEALSCVRDSGKLSPWLLWLARRSCFAEPLR